MRSSRFTAVNMASDAVVLTAGLVACAWGPARADIFKSVDEQGHVVYSDRALTPAARNAWTQRAGGGSW